MDQGLILDRIENGREGVLNRKDETGRQLLQRPPRVHQRRRIRQEVKASHQVEELPCKMMLSGWARVAALGLGDVVGHAPEELRR